MQAYCESLFQYHRLKTREVKVGHLLLGNGHPIRIQTMTTADTMDTKATVEECIRCIDAGSELIRITAPSKTEAQNLLLIKEALRGRGYATPIVADIHFTPNAAEIAARMVEKVRINPGNYVDKKKFEQVEYSDAEYAGEIERIRDRFLPLLAICKAHGTAMRIGTNHGSLSDRIMSRYGDTPTGMVESAMEFLRIARAESYHQVVLSMKSSNPLVMVQAYRLLVKTMDQEFGECYPLHLGVTEAGDGEEGRIKSAVGIGCLLEDGLGDTIRVSLTEDPELEIPVCKDIVKRYGSRQSAVGSQQPASAKIHLPYDPFSYARRQSFAVEKVGGNQVPVVIADLSKLKSISPVELKSIGYTYDPVDDKWHISDAAADFVFAGALELPFNLPGSLRVILTAKAWEKATDKNKYLPIYESTEYRNATAKSHILNFVMLDCKDEIQDNSNLDFLRSVKHDELSRIVLCLSSTNTNAMQSVRRMFIKIGEEGIRNPVILITDSGWQTPDEHLVHFATETGALLLDGFGDGICLGYNGQAQMQNVKVRGRTYVEVNDIYQFTNNAAFNILQATRTRISKTEYISCPSCGRTLFDLQETTAKIRAVTSHLKGVKIAIMGCIVNGPGEMADADFGYVGSGPGKITLYRGKEVMKRNVNSEVAVEELLNLLKENKAWTEP